MVMRTLPETTSGYSLLTRWLAVMVPPMPPPMIKM